ncbi:MAG: type I-E CRISPR-associated protein Cas6/Cse3/CasE [Chloroflexota bacterium]
MMFLSTLLINVGINPDRPRPGRLWLRNRYRVHQRLAMAFPSDQRKDRDPEFLAPYDFKDFPEQRSMADGFGYLPDRAETAVGSNLLAQVHSPRIAGAGFLFRVDPLTAGRAVILVLSHQKPDWNYAFGLIPGQIDSGTGSPAGNAGYLLAALPDEPRPLQVSLNLDARFRFRLTANPTKKTATPLKSARLEMAERGTKDPKRHGCRVPVRAEDYGLDSTNTLQEVIFRKWLVSRSEAHGFRLVEPIKDTLRTEAGYVYMNKTQDSSKGQKLRSVTYDGLLEIVDPARFSEALRGGIGPAKAFGFGLLSIAPVHP